MSTKNVEGNVLLDPNDYCHIPWGAASFSGSGGHLSTQAFANGYLLCQGHHNEPTFSSIWSNVIYGGKGYGKGIVP